MDAEDILRVHFGFSLILCFGFDFLALSHCNNRNKSASNGKYLG